MIIPLYAMAINWWIAQREDVESKLNAADYTNALTALDDLIANLESHVNTNVPIAERPNWSDRLIELKHTRRHLGDGIVADPGLRQAEKDKQKTRCIEILNWIRDN